MVNVHVLGVKHLHDWPMDGQQEDGEMEDVAQQQGQQEVGVGFEGVDGVNGMDWPQQQGQQEVVQQQGLQEMAQQQAQQEVAQQQAQQEVALGLEGIDGDWQEMLPGLEGVADDWVLQQEMLLGHDWVDMQQLQQDGMV